MRVLGIVLVALITLFAIPANVVTAAPDRSGSTIELLTSDPIQFGDEVTFLVHIGKHYTDPKLATHCYQPGFLVGQGEGIFVDKYGKTWDGEVVFTPRFNINYDSTKSADCYTGVFQEPASAKKAEFFVTKTVEYLVLPKQITAYCRVV